MKGKLIDWVLAVSLIGACFVYAWGEGPPEKCRFDNPQKVEQMVWRQPGVTIEVIEKTLEEISATQKINAYEVYERHLAKALAPKAKEVLDAYRQVQQVGRTSGKYPRITIEMMRGDTERIIEETLKELEKGNE